MSCMKCGKKTEGTNVFCPECLEDMRQYPVKSGTKVHIPVRPELPERKQARIRKERSPEERITSLHKLVQILVIMVISLATTLAVTLGVLVYTVVNDAAPEQSQFPMSRNYTTSATQDGD